MWKCSNNRVIKNFLQLLRNLHISIFTRTRNLFCKCNKFQQDIESYDINHWNLHILQPRRNDMNFNYICVNVFNRLSDSIITVTDPIIHRGITLSPKSISIQLFQSYQEHFEDFTDQLKKGPSQRRYHFNAGETIYCS